jgi:sulfoxide reductase heme-binding subunit YedZ
MAKPRFRPTRIRTTRPALGLLVLVVALASHPLPAFAATTASTADPANATANGVVTAGAAQLALHRTAATAGFLAYALMVGTVIWGVLTTTGFARRSIRRQTLYGGHMTMAVMALSFTFIHVVANVLNPVAPFRAVAAVVPFAGSSPFGVALGVIGAELTLCAALSVWFQHRLSYSRWHRLHQLSYPAYGFAIAHTIVSGSDVRRQLIQVLLAVSVLAVGALFVLRTSRSTSLVRARLSPEES